MLTFTDRPVWCALALVLAGWCGSQTVLAAPVTVQVTNRSGAPLAEAVVYLESREAKAAARPMAQAEMVQIERAFRPAVLAVTTGTPVSFPNRDTVRHHVYSFSPAKKFELKLYIGKPEAPVVFDQPGIAVLGCNIHDQMVAWVVVVDTPYLGQTDARGQVSLEAPAGSYRLRVWHPNLPVGAPADDVSFTLRASGGQVRHALSVP